jgi:hypothetical protein
MRTPSVRVRKGSGPELEWAKIAATGPKKLGVGASTSFVHECYIKMLRALADSADLMSKHQGNHCFFSATGIAGHPS